MVTQNARACRKIELYGEKYPMSAFDLINCLTQIKFPTLINMCAPISKVPSNISTMYLLYLYVTCIALSFVMI